MVVSCSGWGFSIVYWPFTSMYIVAAVTTTVRIDNDLWTFTIISLTGLPDVLEYVSQPPEMNVTRKSSPVIRITTSLIVSISTPHQYRIN